MVTPATKKQSHTTGNGRFNGKSHHMGCAPLTVQGYGRCDQSLHPQGQAALISCWSGRLYLVRHDGTVQATIEVGGPARLRWGADGRFVVAGTQQGEIWRVEADGTTAWHTRLPVRQAPPEAQPLKPVFAPGHSFDTVVYVLDLAGQRVFLTGDIGFHGNNDILNRCWGDVPKARTVMKILRAQVLPLQPETVFTGHDEHSNGVEYWQDILRAT